MQTHPLSQLPVSGNYSLQLANIKNSFRQIKSLEAKLKTASGIDHLHQLSEDINKSLFALSKKTQLLIDDYLANS